MHILYTTNHPRSNTHMHSTDMAFVKPLLYTFHPFPDTNTVSEPRAFHLVIHLVYSSKSTQTNNHHFHSMLFQILERNGVLRSRRKLFYGSCIISLYYVHVIGPFGRCVLRLCIFHNSAFLRLPNYF